MTDLHDLIKLVTDLKASILETEGDLEYRCAAATNFICSLIPEAEHMKGHYDGEQHHWAALDVNGELIVLDATVGQFSNAPEVFVGIGTHDWDGVSYGNTQMNSGVDEEPIRAAMMRRGWMLA